LPRRARAAAVHILAEITKLRRACYHPGLIDPAMPLSGATLQAFLELVDDLIRNKHKALVSASSWAN
jgi:SNF2 family DNA or RNA helicase